MDVVETFKKHGINPEESNEEGWDKYDALIWELQSDWIAREQEHRDRIKDKEAIISTLSKAIQVMFKQMID